MFEILKGFYGQYPTSNKNMIKIMSCFSAFQKPNLLTLVTLRLQYKLNEMKKLLVLSALAVPFFFAA
ncbi:MAG TPA: hypothetical protein VJ499_03355, partial [Flavisolibacter sp.]|nr:hypothetical protein [Flavisolibacter sp.]